MNFQVVDVGSTIYYQALCLVSETTQIKMQCTSTDKIKILRTVYGYNPGYANVAPTAIDSCAFSIKDCHFDKEYSIDNECTGRNTCLMTISKQRVMNESVANFQTCKEYNYVQINYQCLPSKTAGLESPNEIFESRILRLFALWSDLPTKDICGVSQSELSHAYIVSPSFPNIIKNGLNCECTLISNYENGQILLRRVDMKVRATGSLRLTSGGW